MNLTTKHYFPGSGGTKAFPTDSVRFEAGAFKSCKLKHVSLPNDVYGPPLCTVFDQGVTLSSDTAVNTTAELCPIEEEAEKMPLFVPLPQRMAPAAGVTQYVGLSVGKTAADAVAALEFPHSAVLEKPPDSGGNLAEDTSWLTKIKNAASCVLAGAMTTLYGNYVAYERTIALAMVRDGMVHARFPLPPAVHTVSQLLDFVDAADSIATCEGTHAPRTAAIELNKFYTIF